MPLNAKLVVVGGDVKTAEIKLRLPSTVGRGRGTTIMLPHPLVSRQHCELFEVNGQLMVRDLGSLNGTFVNNQRITESPLPPGELLTIGTVTFRAMYEASSESQPPPGAGPQLKPARRSETDATLPAPQPASAADSDEDVQFNFDEPVIPVEEEEASPAPANATHATKRMEDAPGPTKTASVASAKTTPAPPKAAPAKAAPPVAKPLPAAAKPAAKPAAPGKSDATVDASKWKEDGEEAVEGEEIKGDEDDDLGDFLKSLGK